VDDQIKSKFSQAQRSIAIFLLISFTLLNTSVNLYAETLPGSLPHHGISQADPAKILDSLKLPEELGSILEVFSGRFLGDGPLGDRPSLKTVRPVPARTVPERLIIYVQDAHSNYDSESNVNKIIRHFQDEHQLPLVLLEGGEGKLDNLFFKSFPDEKAKAKLLDQYLKQGDLQGAEVASILNEDIDTNFYGIESQSLYNENKQAFLEAMAKESEILTELSKREAELDQKAVSSLTPQAASFKQAHDKFRAENINLLDYVKALAELQATSCKLQDNKPEACGLKLGAELSKLIQSEQNEKTYTGVDYDIATNELIEYFKFKILPDLSKEEQVEIGSLIQDYRTARLDRGFLVKKFSEIASTHEINLEIPEILKQTAKHVQTLESIKGTQLFDELEQFEDELRNTLSKSPTEKQILSDYKELELLKSFAKLEITHKEWKSISECGMSNTECSIGSIRTPNSALRTLFVNHFKFYELALKRDEALFNNALKVMDKEKSKLALITTGGFHSEGIKQMLKDQNIPFILISPRINQIGTKDNYLNAMKDKRSFMKYYKGSLWDAFAQDYAIRIIQGRFLGDGPQGDRPSPNMNDLTPQLKRWRDRIIQNSIAEGRITQATNYTKYVDALIQSLRTAYSGQRAADSENTIQEELDVFLNLYFGKLRNLAEQKIENLSEGLKELFAQKEISAKSVETLLNRINLPAKSNLQIPAVLAGGPASKNELRALDIQKQVNVLREIGISPVAAKKRYAEEVKNAEESKSELRGASLEQKILNDEQLASLVTSTPDNVRWIHRTAGSENVVEAILNEGLNLWGTEGKLGSTASLMSADREESLNGNNGFYHRFTRRGADRFVVVIEVPRSVLEKQADRSHQPGALPNTFTVFHGADKLNFQAEQLAETTAGRKRLPPQFIKGYIDRDNMTFHPNPHFEGSSDVKPSSRAELRGRNASGWKKEIVSFIRKKLTEIDHDLRNKNLEPADLSEGDIETAGQAARAVYDSITENEISRDNLNLTETALTFNSRFDRLSYLFSGKPAIPDGGLFANPAAVYGSVFEEFGLPHSDYRFRELSPDKARHAASMIAAIFIILEEDYKDQLAEKIFLKLAEKPSVFTVQISPGTIMYQTDLNLLKSELRSISAESATSPVSRVALEVTNQAEVEIERWVRQKSGQFTVRVIGDDKSFDFTYLVERDTRPGSVRHRIDVYDGVNQIGFVNFLISQDAGTRSRKASMNSAFRPFPVVSGTRHGEAVYVDSKYSRRYRGIGRTLMSLAMQVAQREGAEEFHVYGPTDSALSFYQNLGFKPIGASVYNHTFPLEARVMAEKNIHLPLISIETRKRAELRAPLARFESRLNGLLKKIQTAAFQTELQTAEELGAFLRKQTILADDAVWKEDSSGNSEASKRIEMFLKKLSENSGWNQPSSLFDLTYAERALQYFANFEFKDWHLPRLYRFHKILWRKNQKWGLKLINEQMRHIRLFWQGLPEPNGFDEYYSHLVIDDLYLVRQIEIASDALGTDFVKWLIDAVRKKTELAEYAALAIVRLIVVRPDLIEKHISSSSLLNFDFVKQLLAYLATSHFQHLLIPAILAFDPYLLGHHRYQNSSQNYAFLQWVRSLPDFQKSGMVQTLNGLEQALSITDQEIKREEDLKHLRTKLWASAGYRVMDELQKILANAVTDYSKERGVAVAQVLNQNNVSSKELEDISKTIPGDILEVRARDGKVRWFVAADTTTPWISLAEISGATQARINVEKPDSLEVLEESVTNAPNVVRAYPIKKILFYREPQAVPSQPVNPDELHLIMLRFGNPDMSNNQLDQLIEQADLLIPAIHADQQKELRQVRMDAIVRSVRVRLEATKTSVESKQSMDRWIAIGEADARFLGKAAFEKYSRKKNPLPALKAELSRRPELRSLQELREKSIQAIQSDDILFSYILEPDGTGKLVMNSWTVVKSGREEFVRRLEHIKGGPYEIYHAGESFIVKKDGQAIGFIYFWENMPSEEVVKQGEERTWNPKNEAVLGGMLIAPDYRQKAGLELSTALLDEYFRYAVESGWRDIDLVFPVTLPSLALTYSHYGFEPAPSEAIEFDIRFGGTHLEHSHPVEVVIGGRVNGQLSLYFPEEFGQIQFKALLGLYGRADVYHYLDKAPVYGKKLILASAYKLRPERKLELIKRFSSSELRAGEQIKEIGAIRTASVGQEIHLRSADGAGRVFIILEKPEKRAHGATIVRVIEKNSGNIFFLKYGDSQEILNWKALSRLPNRHLVSYLILQDQAGNETLISPAVTPPSVFGDQSLIIPQNSRAMTVQNYFTQIRKIAQWKKDPDQKKQFQEIWFKLLIQSLEAAEEVLRMNFVSIDTIDANLWVQGEADGQVSVKFGDFGGFRTEAHYDRRIYRLKTFRDIADEFLSHKPVWETGLDDGGTMPSVVAYLAEAERIPAEKFDLPGTISELQKIKENDSAFKAELRQEIQRSQLRKGFLRLALSAVVTLGTIGAFTNQSLAQSRPPRTKAPRAEGAQPSQTDQRIQELARAYLARALEIDSKTGRRKIPLMIHSGSWDQWRSIIKEMKGEGISPKKFGDFMNELYLKALRQLTDKGVSARGAEGADIIARQMLEIISPAKAKVGEAPKTWREKIENAPELIMIRFWMNGIAIPKDEKKNLSDRELEKLMNDFGLSQKAIEKTIQFRREKNSDQAMNLLEILIRNNLTQIPKQVSRKEQAEYFMLAIFDPYLALMEASRASGRPIGKALRDQIAQQYVKILKGKKFDFHNFIIEYGRKQINIQMKGAVGELNQVMRKFGYRLQFHPRHNVLYRITHDIPIGFKEIESVLIIKKIGVNKTEFNQPPYMLEEPAILILDEDIQKRLEEVNQIVDKGRSPDPIDGMILRVIAGDPIKIQSESLARVRKRLYEMDFKQKPLASREELAVGNRAIFELKMKFDASKGFAAGKVKGFSKLSALAAVMAYGPAPATALEDWLVFLVKSYPHVLSPARGDSTIKEMLRRELIEAWKTAQDFESGKISIDQFREWAKERYDAMRDDFEDLPDLEDFEPIAEAFMARTELRQNAGEASQADKDLVSDVMRQMEGVGVHVQAMLEANKAQHSLSQQFLNDRALNDPDLKQTNQLLRRLETVNRQLKALMPTMMDIHDIGKFYSAKGQQNEILNELLGQDSDDRALRDLLSNVKGVQRVTDDLLEIVDNRHSELRAASDQQASTDFILRGQNYQISLADIREDKQPVVANGIAEILERLMKIASWPAEKSVRVQFGRKVSEDDFERAQSNHLSIQLLRMFVQRAKDFGRPAGGKDEQQYDADVSDGEYDDHLDEAQISLILAHEIAHDALRVQVLDDQKDLRSLLGLRKIREQELAVDRLTARYLLYLGFSGSEISAAMKRIAEYYEPVPTHVDYAQHSILRRPIEWISRTLHLSWHSTQPALKERFRQVLGVIAQDGSRIAPMYSRYSFREYANRHADRLARIQSGIQFTDDEYQNAVQPFLEATNRFARLTKRGMQDFYRRAKIKIQENGYSRVEEIINKINSANLTAHFPGVEPERLTEGELRFILEELRNQLLAADPARRDELRSPDVEPIVKDRVRITMDGSMKILISPLNFNTVTSLEAFSHIAEEIMFRDPNLMRSLGITQNAWQHLSEVTIFFRDRSSVTLNVSAHDTLFELLRGKEKEGQIDEVESVKLHFSEDVIFTNLKSELRQEPSLRLKEMQGLPPVSDLLKVLQKESVVLYEVKPGEPGFVFLIQNRILVKLYLSLLRSNFINSPGFSWLRFLWGKIGKTGAKVGIERLQDFDDVTGLAHIYKALNSSGTDVSHVQQLIINSDSLKAHAVLLEEAFRALERDFQPRDAAELVLRDVVNDFILLFFYPPRYFRNFESVYAGWNNEVKAKLISFYSGSMKNLANPNRNLRGMIQELKADIEQNESIRIGNETVLLSELFLKKQRLRAPDTVKPHLTRERLIGYLGKLLETERFSGHDPLFPAWNSDTGEATGEPTVTENPEFPRGPREDWRKPAPVLDVSKGISKDEIDLKNLKPGDHLIIDTIAYVTYTLEVIEGGWVKIWNHHGPGYYLMNLNQWGKFFSEPGRIRRGEQGVFPYYEWSNFTQDRNAILPAGESAWTASISEILVFTSELRSELRSENHQELVKRLRKSLASQSFSVSEAEAKTESQADQFLKKPLKVKIYGERDGAISEINRLNLEDPKYREILKVLIPDLLEFISKIDSSYRADQDPAEVYEHKFLLNNAVSALASFNDPYLMSKLILHYEKSFLRTESLEIYEQRVRDYFSFSNLQEMGRAALGEMVLYEGLREEWGPYEFVTDIRKRSTADATGSILKAKQPFSIDFSKKPAGKVVIWLSDANVRANFFKEEPFADRAALVIEKHGNRYSVKRGGTSVSSIFFSHSNAMLLKRINSLEVLPHAVSGHSDQKSDYVVDLDQEPGSQKALTVGRADDNDIVTDLGAAWISRHHAKVTLLKDRVVVEDLGSSNGTQVVEGIPQLNLKDFYGAAEAKSELRTDTLNENETALTATSSSDLSNTFSRRAKISELADLIAPELMDLIRQGTAEFDDVLEVLDELKKRFKPDQNFKFYVDVFLAVNLTIKRHAPKLTPADERKLARVLSKRLIELNQKQDAIVSAASSELLRGPQPKPRPELRSVSGLVRGWKRKAFIGVAALGFLAAGFMLIAPRLLAISFSQLEPPRIKMRLPHAEQLSELIYANDAPGIFRFLKNWMESENPKGEYAFIDLVIKLGKIVKQSAAPIVLEGKGLEQFVNELQETQSRGWETIFNPQASDVIKFEVSPRRENDPEGALARIHVTFADESVYLLRFFDAQTGEPVEIEQKRASEISGLIFEDGIRYEVLNGSTGIQSRRKLGKVFGKDIWTPFVEVKAVLVKGVDGKKAIVSIVTGDLATAFNPNPLMSLLPIASRSELRKPFTDPEMRASVQKAIIFQPETQTLGGSSMMGYVMLHGIRSTFPNIKSIEILTTKPDFYDGELGVTVIPVKPGLSERSTMARLAQQIRETSPDVVMIDTAYFPEGSEYELVLFIDQLARSGKIKAPYLYLTTETGVYLEQPLSLMKHGVKTQPRVRLPDGRWVGADTNDIDLSVEERQKSFLRSLGVEFDTVQIPFQVTDEFRDLGKKIIKEALGVKPDENPDRPVIILNPHGNFYGHGDASEKWAAIALKLLELEKSGNIYFLFASGSPADQPESIKNRRTLDKIETAIRQSDPNFALQNHRLPPWNVSQMRSVLSAVDFLVSIQTGAAHIADGLGIPTVVWSRNDSGEKYLRPADDRWQIVHAVGESDINKVTAETVQKLTSFGAFTKRSELRRIAPETKLTDEVARQISGDVAAEFSRRILSQIGLQEVEMAPALSDRQVAEKLNQLVKAPNTGDVVRKISREIETRITRAFEQKRQEIKTLLLPDQQALTAVISQALQAAPELTREGEELLDLIRSSVEEHLAASEPVISDAEAEGALNAVDEFTNSTARKVFEIQFSNVDPAALKLVSDIARVDGNSTFLIVTDKRSELREIQRELGRMGYKASQFAFATKAEPNSLAHFEEMMQPSMVIAPAGTAAPNENSRIFISDEYVTGSAIPKRLMPNVIALAVKVLASNHEEGVVENARAELRAQNEGILTGVAAFMYALGLKARAELRQKVSA